MISAIRRSGAMLAGVAVIAAIAGCGAQQAAEPSVSTLKTTVIGLVLSGNWNPQTSTYLNTFSVPQQAVYETLVQFNPATFEVEPLLAEEFEISDDQLSMRIKLREDVDFTDGTHLDAEAAVTAFEYALETPTHATLVNQYAAEITAIGEYELEVTSTAAINTEFLFWVGLVPIGSPTAMETDPVGMEATPVGTGPYVLTDQVADVSATFERNPDYRNPDAYPFDVLEFTIYDDPVAASNALKSGQLNAAVVDPAYAADLEQNGLVLHLGVASHFFLQWTDPTGEVVPQLTDRRVRQAIAYSIDRASIIESLEYGFGTLTTQAWGKGSPFYIEGADDTYAYDLDKARDLMAEAGYEGGFAVTIPGWSGNTAKYEPVVTQALADIGITVTFEQFAEAFDYNAAGDSGDYALALRSASDLYLSGALRNIGNGGIPEILGLFDVVDHGTVQEAAAAQHDIGQIVLDDAIVIALSRPAEIWVTIPEITVESSIVSWPVILASFQLAD